MDYLTNALKLIVALIALLVIVRLLGRKELAEMTPFDIVYLLLFGGIVEETLFDSKISVWNLLFTLAVWASLIFLIEKVAQRSDKGRVILMGRPVYLIRDGKLDTEAFKSNALEMEQLRIMLRQSGIFSLREVKDLFIETNGAFSINTFAKYKPATVGDLGLIEKEEEPSVLLIDRGTVKREMLRTIGKKEEWLLDSMADLGYGGVQDILYCEWSKSDGFYVRTYEDTMKAGEIE
ncbi:DUF421 domain-containing protein [Edaphobacillus lindanitolerans]|uniref:Uncharacterized membrane protein YcaP, DUF421 family n=1 Tax=Edaphobacillus lindanitolerans TaxID=550447 RepID=A0A1U7PIB4_9BACI|nr:DUF421 domain-containing protein [Edaphobacillus lindanitolerans]SIT66196.1 Uncharacterized membrane protein YcaP, DUF421 family [Edaphobacillus lindanitolerans]